MQKRAERLRLELVARLQAKGVLRSPAVANAFATVPRERFIAQVAASGGIEAVYSDRAFVTKHDPRGLPLSSSSQPALMARMLELLEIGTGQRVLEIGAGTGYNAALLSELVGPNGRVTSVEVDRDVARTAKATLRDQGYRVNVVVGDGRGGWPKAAPYDRIIVTASADRVPRAWLGQLRDGGLLELPLRLDPARAAIQVIPVFERRGDRLSSVSLTWGGFMPLHGGDGGWQAPPAMINASRSSAGDDAALVSITGPALANVSGAGAKKLLAALLAGARSVASGWIEMSSAHPPLLLLYLLLKIPAGRRLGMHDGERLGVGVIDRRTRSLAFVSLRSPWARESERGDAAGRPEPAKIRVRWRLDAYGGESAADELRRLLATWAQMRKSGRQTLRITGSGSAVGAGSGAGTGPGSRSGAGTGSGSRSGAGETLDLRFAWTKG
jgi:protein-L-isoaspartate(D-aspartate) O-methyltransferase